MVEQWMTLSETLLTSVAMQHQANLGNQMFSKRSYLWCWSTMTFPAPESQSSPEPPHWPAPSGLLSTSKQWETPTAIKANTRISRVKLPLWSPHDYLASTENPSLFSSLIFSKPKACILNFPTLQREERFKESKDNREKVFFPSWCINATKTGSQKKGELPFGIEVEYSVSVLQINCTTWQPLNSLSLALQHSTAGRRWCMEVVCCFGFS